MLGIHPKIKKVYERFFNSEDGKAVLEDLKNRFHFYSSSGTADTNQKFIEEGERAVVCYILGLSNKLNEQHLDIINNILMEKE